MCLHKFKEQLLFYVLLGSSYVFVCLKYRRKKKFQVGRYTCVLLYPNYCLLQFCSI